MNKEEPKVLKIKCLNCDNAILLSVIDGKKDLKFEREIGRYANKGHQILTISLQEARDETLCFGDCKSKETDPPQK